MKNFFTENRLLYKNAPPESGGSNADDIKSQAQSIEDTLANAPENSKEISEKTEQTREQVKSIMNWKTAARITGAAVFAPWLAAEVAYAGYKGTKYAWNHGGREVKNFATSRVGAVTKTGLSGAGEISGSLAMAPLRGVNAGVNGIGAMKNITLGSTKKIASLIPGVLNLATKPFSYFRVPGAEYVNSTFKDAQGNWSKSGGESFKASGNNLSNIGNRLGETAYDAKNVAFNIPSTAIQMGSELVKPDNNFTPQVENLENTIVQSKLPKKLFSTDPEKNGKFFSVPDEKSA